MLAMLKQLWKDEEGPTAVEYALMVALVAVGIITAVGLMTDQLNLTFGEVTTAMSTAGD